jgi:iron complex outermembrane receptor protein
MHTSGHTFEKGRLVMLSARTAFNLAQRKQLVQRRAMSALLFTAAVMVSHSPGVVAQTLDEVIVTAQKREQSLQDVSAAVSAVDATRLESAQINTLEDLQLIVPTVTFGNDFNMAKIFIRGVGANTSTTGSEPGVALHVDGAVISRAEAQLTSLFDLDRVEVLRGPQGTLYGRNATSGSINLITAKPTAQPDGYARVTLGNYDTAHAEAALGGPITETIRGRVAFASRERSGFGRNPVTGNDVDDLNRTMGRVHLQFLPSETMDFLVTGEWYDQDDASGAVKFRRETFPGDPERAATGIGGYATNPRDLASEFDPGTQTETWALTTTFNWSLTDALTFRNISNYRDFETSITQDLDTSAVVNSLQINRQATTIQRRDVESRQYSTEFQLNFASEQINSVLGLFYFDEDQRPTDTVGLTPDFGMPSNIALITNAPTVLNNTPGPPSGPPVGMDMASELCNRDLVGAINNSTPQAPKRVCIHSDLDTQAWAVFGQATVGLGRFTSALDALSLKVGGRYSWEERQSANPAYIIAANGAGPVLQFTQDFTFRERTFEDFTPEGGLEWRPMSDVMLYYTYSEGFKSGSGENAAGSTTIVNPEEIQNHEVGLKSSWLDRRLAVNVSLFSYELQGLQINKTISGGPSGFLTIFENAADVSGEGVEVEFFGTPVEPLRLSGSVAWLDAQFDDFETADPLNPVNVATPPGGSNPPPATIQPIQLAGNPTRNSPEWAANLHMEFDIPTPELPYEGALTLLGDVSYKDNVFFTEFHRLLEGSEAYTMYDAALRYSSGNGRFTAELWGKNLSDELREASTFALATARTLGVTYLPPRTYGVSFGYSF